MSNVNLDLGDVKLNNSSFLAHYEQDNNNDLSTDSTNVLSLLQETQQEVLRPEEDVELTDNECACMIED